MPSPALHLIPTPHSIKRKPGSLRLDSISEIALAGRTVESTRVAAGQLGLAIGGATGGAPSVVERRSRGVISALLDVRARGPRGAHTIHVDAKGIRVTGDSEGVFHGVQTLRQLISQRGTRLPAIEIVDAPDFAARGFYHDITRGKVPRLDTLMALAEKMSRYKLNQLQLYVEHTFAFRDHPDIWAGADPLTASDIVALDEHCARHHVELVPSLSTFGHFYTALVSPAKQHLNELPLDGSRLPFSWWDRMGHYTLDCLNPESLELVRGMIHEMRPLFRSRFFNICCDETFDLGRGRNAPAAAALGTGRLYTDFLVKIMACVREAKAVPMFWGDIIGNHPELVSRIPREAVALDWSYSADIHESKSRLFKRAGRKFYVCPGTSAWDRWMSDVDTASANITGFARRGLRDGAVGLLNTDWGDCGHVNALGNSFHGMLLGAACAWNARGTSESDFDRAFDALEFGSADAGVAALLREIGSSPVIRWRMLTLWLDPSPHRPHSWWDPETGIPTAILQQDARAAFAAWRKITRLREKLGRALAAARPTDPFVAREMLVGARGHALMQALGGLLICLGNNRKLPRSPDPIAISNELRRFESEASAVWHARNRPSEYFRVRGALLEFARRLERLARGMTPVKTPRAAVP
jgi:hypothetical protein